MAHSLSAKKRIRQNVKSRALNRWRKRSYRNLIAAFHASILHGTVEDAETKLQALYKTLDQIASTSALHKNAAARHKSRLASKLNAKKAAAATAA